MHNCYTMNKYWNWCRCIQRRNLTSLGYFNSKLVIAINVGQFFPENSLRFPWHIFIFPWRGPSRSIIYGKIFWPPPPTPPPPPPPPPHPPPTPPPPPPPHPHPTPPPPPLWYRSALTGNIWCYNEVTPTYKNTQMIALFRTITYLPSYFLNTYYHKQISNMLIAAFNETFRQSSDPVYAHTPMRNVGARAPYFQPKVKDFARGEVKN